MLFDKKLFPNINTQFNNIDSEQIFKFINPNSNDKISEMTGIN